LKITIEVLSGEIKLNSVRNSATIDALTQEVETLRKQLRDQKKNHDAEMELMQSRYDELSQQN
jgi:AmiR/NasT family two-component response regulator